MCHVTLTTPLSGMTVISRLGLPTVNLQTKFEVSNHTHYEAMKSSDNIQIGVIWGS